MQPHAAERHHLERQITYARPIFLVLAVGDLLGQSPPSRGPYSIGFVLAYLAVAVALLLLQHLPRIGNPRVPLAADLVALAIFLLLTPSASAFWFVYLFVALAAGIRWGLERCILLAGAVTLAVLVRAAFQGGSSWVEVLSWTALVVGTFAGGVGLSLLGDRQRRHAAEHEFLARLTQTLQVEQGVNESLRLLLNELARGFHCQRAVFVYRDVELERIFVWSAVAEQVEHISPANMPLSLGEAFLLDCPETSLCWSQPQTKGNGAGFAWDRRDGRRAAVVPPVSAALRDDFGLSSLMASSFDFAGEPVGRIILGNGRQRFLPQDLGVLDRAVRHLSPALENLFTLRRLRTRSIEGERSRISRDIHDGILQTLLSVDIQLDVLRRKGFHAPEQAAADLATLQHTVRNETEELRRMVTDMRPLRVESADLVDLMRGFAERFRNESGPALDLLVDAAALQVPDRICRELFQIYREALHNVKKHAHATHVVVKLWQNDSQVVLVVDDNGAGFSFAGRYTGDELDRLRLGPISIKERTRSVGGVLTVESTPGHGARLTIEIPLS
jgi:signal transduction histidine kinase